MSTRFVYISQIFNRFHSNQVPYIFSYTSIYTSSSRIVLYSKTSRITSLLHFILSLFFLPSSSPSFLFVYLVRIHGFLFPFTLRESYYPFTPLAAPFPEHHFFPSSFSLFSTERSSDIFPFIEFFSVKSRFRPPSTTLIYPIHPSPKGTRSPSFSLSLLLLRYFHAFCPFPFPRNISMRLGYLSPRQLHFYSRSSSSILEIKFCIFLHAF